MIKKWIVLLIYIAVPVAAFALYNGNTINDLDATRPPDTGESQAYGASAIREIKRTIKITLTSSVDLVTGLLKSNAVQGYMIAPGAVNSTNFAPFSIPSTAFQTSSIPSYALQTNSTAHFKTQAAYTSISNRVAIGAASGSASTIIPFATNSVLVSQGQQILTATVTPVDSNSTYHVHATVQALRQGGNPGSIALFTNGASPAVAAASQSSNGAGNPFMIVLDCQFAARTAASIIFTLRAGPTDTGTLVINGLDSPSGNPAFAPQSCFSSMEIEELR